MTDTPRVKIQLPVLMRKHLPTGRVWQATWSAAQHWMLGCPEYYSAVSLQKVCESLVEKWNRQQPENWQYWLA